MLWLPKHLEGSSSPQIPIAILQTQTPGQAFAILDMMAPLVIKLFESQYLYSVSWETHASPSPELGAVPLSQAWEQWKKAVTREWTAGETSQQHQNEVGGRNMEQGQKHAIPLSNTI